MSVDAHRQAEALMAKAERLAAEGRVAEARDLYAAAARYEAQALQHIPTSRPRTRGIIAVSAVSLFRQGGALEDAIRHAHLYLADADLPEFAQSQLEDSLLDAKREMRAIAVGHTLGASSLAVFLRGGGLETGLARLDTVILKLIQFEKYILRVGEWVANKPFREQGPVDSDVVQLINPMISEPSTGSFHFELRLEAPLEPKLPIFTNEPGVTPDRVADALFVVLSAAKDEDPSEFEERVQDKQYREVFSRLVRNLVPDGKELTKIELRRLAKGESDSAVLVPENRQIISKHLGSGKKRTEPQEVHPGVLRALDLDRGWIRLVEGDQTAKYKIVGQIFDDVVGPFVNRRVRVEGYRKRGRGKFVVSDILPDAEDIDRAS